MFEIDNDIIKNKKTLLIHDTKRGLNRDKIINIIDSVKDNIDAVFFSGNNPADNPEIPFVIKKLLKDKIYVGIRVYDDEFNIPTVDLIDAFCGEDKNNWMNILAIGYGHQIRLTIPYEYISTDEDIQLFCKYIGNNILYPDEVSIEYIEDIDIDEQERISNQILTTLKEKYTYSYDKVRVRFLKKTEIEEY